MKQNGHLNYDELNEKYLGEFDRYMKQTDYPLTMEEFMEIESRFFSHWKSVGKDKIPYPSELAIV